jgi:hypothetical protein
MLSLWQSGAYRLMDDDVPYPSALPTAEGAPTPYKDDEGGVRSEGSGPQSWARAAMTATATGDLRSAPRTPFPRSASRAPFLRITS